MKKNYRSLFSDDKGEVRLITKTLSFEEMFHMVIGPIRHYGKADTIIVETLLDLIKTLGYLDRMEKQQIEFLNKYLLTIMLDANESIPNKTDWGIIQRKVSELLSIGDYFYSATEREEEVSEI